MAWMEVLAPAKLNLFLELIEQRSDGFHELETIMTSVNLFDSILLRRRLDDRVTLSQVPVPRRNNPNVFSMPLNRTNLVWQAIDLLRQCTGKSIGVDVAIQKNIPNQAGMGGGSSDAASTLVAVNRMFDLKLSIDQLQELANQLGSDIAFFINNRTARCLGRGEQVHPLTMAAPLHFVVAMPPVGLSTPEVFRHSHVADQPIDSATLRQHLRRGNPRGVAAGLWNRLQESASQLCPWVSRLADEFQRSGCDGHQMTGSGTAWFGLFRSPVAARQQKQRLAARLPECSLFFASTIGNDANFIRYRSG